jgi:predicted RNase H-like HicB family nuclease
MTYRAVYEREPDGRWTVEISKVKGCHTYGRTIDQARDRIREALGLFVNHAETAEIVDEVRMPAAVKGAVRNARQMRQRLEVARTRVSAAEQRAVRYLRKTVKLGHRDAAAFSDCPISACINWKRRRPASWSRAVGWPVNDQ